MREVGLKSSKTPVLLALLAEINSQKGDTEKSLQQISRAEKLASEILDGLKSHKKIASILACKSTVYMNIRKYDESI